VKNVRFETAREVPWLALLLLTENLVSGGDLTPQRTTVGAIKGSDPMAYQRLTAQLNLSDATQVSAVVIRGDKLKAILGNPAPADQLTLLTRLCHGKKVTAANGDHRDGKSAARCCQRKTHGRAGVARAARRRLDEDERRDRRD
jgi:hypothetical protein